MVLAQGEQQAAAIRDCYSNSTVEYGNHVREEKLLKGCITSVTFHTVLEVLRGSNRPQIFVLFI